DALLWRAVARSQGDEVGLSETLNDDLSRATRSSPRLPAISRGPRTTEPGDPSLLPPGLPDSVHVGLAELTRTEKLVLQHLSLNKTSRQIAKALFVSVRTVQNHRARICEKLGLRGSNRLLGVAIE